MPFLTPNNSPKTCGNPKALTPVTILLVGDIVKKLAQVGRNRKLIKSSTAINNILLLYIII